MTKPYRDYFIVTGVFVAVTIIFYTLVSVLLKGGITTVYKNWDTPSYVITAISLYDPQVAAANNIIRSVLITPEWTFLPAHFPLYPLLIRTFSFLGYFRVAGLISLGFTWLFLLSFYRLVRAHKLSKHPLLLTIPLIFLTPRWFALYHVGSTEPVFLFFMTMSMTEFLSARHGRGAIWAALAQMTRPQGALLGVGYAVVALVELARTHDLRQVVRTYYPYLLIPAALLGVFTFYYFRTGDFFAFFPAITAFGHFTGTIFPTFNYPAPNIETFWQEVNVYDYLLFCCASLFLFRKKQMYLGVIACVFFIPLLFIGHTDISRYGLPMLPFVFLGFSEIIERPEFVWGTFLMSPAIMLYTINFMAHNHGA